MTQGCPRVLYIPRLNEAAVERSGGVGRPAFAESASAAEREPAPAPFPTAPAFGLRAACCRFRLTPLPDTTPMTRDRIKRRQAGRSPNASRPPPRSGQVPRTHGVPTPTKGQCFLFLGCHRSLYENSNVGSEALPVPAAASRIGVNHCLRRIDEHLRGRRVFLRDLGPHLVLDGSQLVHTRNAVEPIERRASGLQ